MRKIAFIFSVIAVAILAITLFVPGEHEKRMAKIDELGLEARDGDTVKYAITQGDIDSLLKRIDKEYSITDDHDERSNLIEERDELQRVNGYNRIKEAEIAYGRIRNSTILYYNESRCDQLHRDPGICRDLTTNGDLTIYSDLHRDPGRCL